MTLTSGLNMYIHVQAPTYMCTHMCTAHGHAHTHIYSLNITTITTKNSNNAVWQKYDYGREVILMERL